MIDNFKFHFEVEKPPYFLYYTKTEDKSLRFNAAPASIVGSWAEVFYGLMTLPTDVITIQLPYAAISCMNRVAQKSRRGAATVLFVHREMADKIVATLPDHLSTTELVWMADFEPTTIMSCYHKATVRFPEKNRPSPLLDADKQEEIRQANEKFKSDYREGATIVDGPLAVYEDVLYLNPNWKTYFHKATLAEKPQ